MARYRHWAEHGYGSSDGICDNDALDFADIFNSLKKSCSTRRPAPVRFGRFLPQFPPLGIARLGVWEHSNRQPFEHLNRSFQFLVVYLPVKHAAEAVGGDGKAEDVVGGEA